MRTTAHISAFRLSALQRTLLLCLLTVALTACVGSPARVASAGCVADSLNALSYALRYKDLDASEQAAREALRVAGDATDTQRAEALNALGFCAFMRMDFSRADSLYAAASAASANELERLVADVGRMKISQRTARYKAFCDYRSDAQNRLHRIDEDGTLAASPRLGYARSELAIASSIYYYYLRQVPQSMEAIQSVPADETLQRDTAQWLYYLYMRGSGDLAPGDTPEEVTLRELDYLWPCLTVSYRQGYTYFDANASQALAEMIASPDDFALLCARRPAVMKMLNPNDLAGPELSLCYARRALEGFEDYGDLYQISGALRTIATCYNAQGLHAEALDYLARALNLVNRHHEQYYHCTDTLDRLRPYVADTLGAPSVELRWIQKDGILSVPEWIARLREQLSVTYAALGRKAESDYNRNIYLDLLDYTRQDKETESRYLALKAESDRLNRWLIAVAVGFVLLTLGAGLFNRWWDRRHERYTARLTDLVGLCVDILSSDASVAAAARDRMARLRATFPARPSHDERMQTEVIDACLHWYDAAGRQLDSLAETRECIEKERYVHQCHLADNKRENLVKKACLLVVTGILPYIDRALYTLRRLQPETPSRRATQLAYIDELLARINEHNDILALWIKMKPGALSLHVEAFALQALFDVVMKGRPSFEQRRQTLTVTSTDAQVKADKALTLFMINTLTDNARKYTPPGGHITLRATEDADYVEVSVEDDGPGIPADAAERLMSEKMYDAGKGHGFGLMNCRGIIEKYRKTSPFFRVCTFGLDSTPGQGSRFWFRLPKSVKTLVVLLAALFATCLPPFLPQAEAAPDHPFEAAPERPLEAANRFAEYVYQSNVDGYYEDAVQYADSALSAMNLALLEGDSTVRSLPLLTLEGRGEAAELQWLAAGYITDYFILLDVRNEAAVAFLALGEMEKYRYNNNAYVALYKQLSVDTTLEDYCRTMQRSAGAKTVLLLVVALVVLALSVWSYLHHFHPRINARDQLEQLLQFARELVELPLDKEAPKPDYAEDDFVKDTMNRMIGQRTRYARDCMGGRVESIEALQDDVIRITHEENRLHVQNRVLDNCLSALKHETVYYPHRIRQWVEKERAGAPDNASAESMVELMTYYKEIYSTLTACAARQLDEVTFRRAVIPVSDILEETRRTFARLARRQHASATLTVKSPAASEADAALRVKAPASEADAVLRVKAPASEADAVLRVKAPASEADAVLRVMADKVEVAALFEALITEALTALTTSGTPLASASATSCEFTLSAAADRDFVRFVFTDPRRRLTPDQLAGLFDPHLAGMRYVEADRLTGVEYLIAKQVIRDHDAHAGRRGCRIQAEPASPESGLTVWFTLPRELS